MRKIYISHTVWVPAIQYWSQVSLISFSGSISCLIVGRSAQFRPKFSITLRHQAKQIYDADTEFRIKFVTNAEIIEILNEAGHISKDKKENYTIVVIVMPVCKWLCS